MSEAASKPATKDATTQIPDASDSDSDDDWLPGPGTIHDHPFAVVDPFPFLKLAADERRVVLSFLLGARSYPLEGAWCSRARALLRRGSAPYTDVSRAEH